MPRTDGNLLAAEIKRQADRIERNRCRLGVNGGLVSDLGFYVLEYLPDILAALSGPQGEPTAIWQPIETLPMDGTFIVKNAIGQVCPIQRRDGQGIVANQPGFADWTWGNPATHWQPMPSAGGQP